MPFVALFYVTSTTRQMSEKNNNENKTKNTPGLFGHLWRLLKHFDGGFCVCLFVRFWGSGGGGRGGAGDEFFLAGGGQDMGLPRPSQGVGSGQVAPDLSRTKLFARGGDELRHRREFVCVKDKEFMVDFVDYAALSYLELHLHHTIAVEHTKPRIRTSSKFTLRYTKQARFTLTTVLYCAVLCIVVHTKPRICTDSKFTLRYTKQARLTLTSVLYCTVLCYTMRYGTVRLVYNNRNKQ